MKPRFSISSLVVLQILAALTDIDTVKAVNENEMYVACDNLQNTLKCENATNICITKVDIGTSGSDFCPAVLRVKPNNKCTKEHVKNYILEKCNGVKMECMLFYRDTEISEHCKRAFKYVMLHYVCVSSLSKCSTLERPIINSEPLPSYIMAQKYISTKVSSTKTTKTSTWSVIKEIKNSTSRLGEIPVATAQTPGNEIHATTAQDSGYQIPRNLSSLVPGPSSRVPHFRKKVKTCTRKTSSTMATISPKPENTIPLTKPTIRGRNAGHGVLNTCFPLKYYAMVVSSFIVFSLL